ncbi:MAG: nucleotidyl transferase AbiEii/AbiGii toxin family protein [Thioalkalivibrio sp.]|nr:nucleotidyl transferase AbiEii/AbiGii toxin family protein [Thioalkalivibrio sp.]
MNFYPEVMPAPQQAMLRRLAAVAGDRGLYLAGGTALAIQIGHRRSVDLDWFSPSPIDPMALAADLRDAGVPVDVTDIEEGTLHGKAGGVKLSFLEYRYRDLVPPTEWPEYGVRLAALKDLACMKLSAIGGRGSKKDFIDIFALGREKFTLDQMLRFYGQKYDVSDLGHTLFALTYFDDAEQEETPEMLWQIDWDEVKRVIERWVQDYTQKQAPPQSGGGGIRP